MTMQIRQHRYHPPGTPPGTLVAPAVVPQVPVSMTLIAYDHEAVEEKTLSKVEDCLPYLDKKRVTWIHLDGIHNLEFLSKLGEVFHLHPLALEDVLHISQRPKVEDYEKYEFLVFIRVALQDRLEFEQVSLFLGENFLITVQEKPGDVFEPVRERIRSNRGTIRRSGADYLAYALIDTLVDGFFPVLESLGERIEDLEDQVAEKPSRETLQKIHQTRRELLNLRRAIWPERDAINSLLREESPLISPQTQVYLRDCYDHAIRILDILETYREIGTGLMDIYLSSMSNRLNEIMKVLTIITTFFIPLSFIAGIYGMNFNTAKSPWNMPELNWALGYPLALGIMAAVALGFLYFFRRKKWL